MNFSRRDFLKHAGAAALAATTITDLLAESAAKKLWFDISLAEWSLHKELNSKKITNLDFPEIARKEFDISIVEYVNQFFKDKAEDKTYLNDLLKRCKDNGIKNHLIMIDGEGGLGELDAAVRNKAIENHYKWVEAAKYLGCKTIRVNAYGRGSNDEVAKAAIEGLSKLGEFASKTGINVIVENHGGSSSNGQWLSGVMKQVNMKNVGTLPDFGNFCITRKDGGCAESYDRYQGTKELMPFAKGVSAKTYDFDEKGNCIETDYNKILKIVKDSGFKGIAGIEYEGSKLSEREGIKATKALLERVGPLV
ncbi:sugar phosphate isomerase/epimerase family protein [Dyadobacter psychrotolerans]|uniref:Twin-arginine translocation signal domain-containing protein n=1 Tax=Dyadobacter psychrotolerans TaxID=2541721 RepID=A0A4R5DN33_9BACT|nr:sugar phosphate isomerase/epimerase family protein [Dyadobacter psychrotolerans]TDE15722.1 twin-arginine translocation signal domain-containing protein [Dyadobacter psychrotolerans]